MQLSGVNSLKENFIEVELWFSELLLKHTGLPYCRASAVEELSSLNKEVYAILTTDPDFTEKFTSSIECVLEKNPSLCILKRAMRSRQRAELYTIIIVRSLLIRDIKPRLDAGLSLGSYIESNAFRRNILYYDSVLSLIGERDFSRKIIKLCIILESRELIQKKTLKTGAGANSISTSFLRLEIGLSLKFSERLKLNYKCRAYRAWKDRLVGDTYLSISSISKKTSSVFYSEIRPSNAEAVVKLSREGFVIQQRFLHGSLDLLNTKLKTDLGFTRGLTLRQTLDNYEEELTQFDKLFVDALAKLNKEGAVLKTLPWSLLLKLLPFYRKSLERGLKSKYRSVFAAKERFEEKKTLLQRNSFLALINVFSEMNFTIFIVYFEDFRSRIYPLSLLHPMYNKVLRAVCMPVKNLEISEYNHPYIDREQLDTKIRGSNFYRNLSKFFKETLSFRSTRELRDVDRYVLTIILIELGKINKISLIEDGSVTASKFIHEGIKIYTRHLAGWDFTFLDFEELTHVNKYCEVLKHFELTGEWLDFAVNKDAPVSAYQHWTCLRGAKSDQTLVILNLSGDIWTDFYSIIAQRFQSTYSHLYAEKYWEVINRKSLKRCIMTYNYNVTLWSSSNYFLEGVGSQKGSAFLKQNKGDLLKIHNLFYEFLRKEAFSELFQECGDFYSQSSHLSEITNKCRLTFSYKKKSKIHKDVVYKMKGSRWKFREYPYTEEVDSIRTERALPANLIQAADAELAGLLVNKTNCLPIHDSFIVALDECHVLMDETNEFFKQRLGANKDYCLFILL